MTISRTTVESKPEGVQPSDEDIIKFVHDNLRNNEILTNYFSKLSRPLTPNILCMQISEGPDVVNLLGYAAITNTAVFAEIVKLATPEAIDAALLQELVNTEGLVFTLHAVLMHTTSESISQSVIAMLQKASQGVIDNLLPKMVGGVTTLLCAIMTMDEAVALELIKKSSCAALNSAAKIMANINILHTIIEQRISPIVTNHLLSKLERETIDLLMQSPCGNGSTPFKLLFTPAHDEEALDLLTCALVKHTSIEVINTLARRTSFFIADSLDLLSWLILASRSQIVVDVIFSRLDEATIEYLLMESQLKVNPLLFGAMGDFSGAPLVDISKETNKTAVSIARYISKATAAKMLQSPYNDKDQTKKPEDFLDVISLNNAPLFNVIIRKLFETGDRVDLTIKSIYRLDVFNLSRYLAQHPEMDVDELRNSKAFSVLKNWRYKSDFETRLSKAENLLYADVAAALKAYYLLKDNFIFQPLAMIILKYLEIDGSIAQRLEYELLKESKPTQAAELKAVYAEIKGFFAHDKTLRYTSDESALILNYCAPHTGFANVAIADSHKEDKRATSFAAKIENMFMFKPAAAKEVGKNGSFLSQFKTTLFSLTKAPEEKKLDFSASSLRA